MDDPVNYHCKWPGPRSNEVKRGQSYLDRYVCATGAFGCFDFMYKMLFTGIQNTNLSIQKRKIRPWDIENTHIKVCSTKLHKKYIHKLVFVYTKVQNRIFIVLWCKQMLQLSGFCIRYSVCKENPEFFNNSTLQENSGFYLHTLYIFSNVIRTLQCEM